MWPQYLPLATLAYNTFNTANLANYCYIILLKFKHDITKELSNIPTKLLFIIFFLLYEYITERNV